MGRRWWHWSNNIQMLVDDPPYMTDLWHCPRCQMLQIPEYEDSRVVYECDKDTEIHCQRCILHQCLDLHHEACLQQNHNLLQFQLLQLRLPSTQPLGKKNIYDSDDRIANLISLRNSCIFDQIIKYCFNNVVTMKITVLSQLWSISGSCINITAAIGHPNWQYH